MNRLKKIVATGMVAMSAFVPFSSGHSTTLRHDIDSWRDRDNHRVVVDRDHFRDGDRDRHFRRVFRPEIKFKGDRRFVRLHKPFMRRVSRPDFVVLRNRHRNYWRAIPREIRVIDRGNRNNVIIIVNNNTGAFSVNIITIIVDSHFFNTVSNHLWYNRNFDITADTGFNTASFNTGNGIITTGNVNISVE